VRGSSNLDKTVARNACDAFAGNDSFRTLWRSRISAACAAAVRSSDKIAALACELLSSRSSSCALSSSAAAESVWNTCFSSQLGIPARIERGNAADALQGVVSKGAINRMSFPYTVQEVAESACPTCACCKFV